MTAKEITLAAFYFLAFGLSVLTGVILGFTGMNSHTPPVPYGIEFICLSIGIILFLIDLVRKNKTKNASSKLLIHAFGLIANGLIMLYVISLAV